MIASNNFIEHLISLGHSKESLVYYTKGHLYYFKDGTLEVDRVENVNYEHECVIFNTSSIYPILRNTTNNDNVGELVWYNVITDDANMRIIQTLILCQSGEYTIANFNAKYYHIDYTNVNTSLL